MLFEQIAWAVPPTIPSGTRPVELVRAMTRLGQAPESPTYYFHGSSLPLERTISTGRVLPGTRLAKGIGDASRLAILSPVFFQSKSVMGAAWADFYDDWSIAPDIHPLHRAYARYGYSLATEGRAASVTTCNSEYMRKKLRLARSTLVPNGVDETLSTYVREGDAQRRLVILGKFFPGRTDFGMISDVIETGRFDEVVIGMPGSSAQMHAVVHGAEHAGVRVTVHDWVSPELLGRLTGEQTVALVPHLVTDYTLSQDPMKFYQFLALGIPVIAPRLLWPQHLPLDFTFLVDFGARLKQTLPEWIEKPAATDSWRREFASRHSWLERAKRISELHGVPHGR